MLWIWSQFLQSTSEDQLDFRIDEGEQYNILDDPNIYDIQLDPGFQQIASKIICSDLDNNGFQVANKVYLRTRLQQVLQKISQGKTLRHLLQVRIRSLKIVLMKTRMMTITTIMITMRTDDKYNSNTVTFFRL